MKRIYHLNLSSAGICLFKGIFLFSLLLLFSSCANRQDNLLTFIDDETIEYTSDFKISSLLVKADGYTRDNFIINDEDTTIKLPNQKTVMVNYEDKSIKLGTVKLCFRYSNVNYYKTVIFQDTTPPSIDCKNKFEVALNNPYFDIKKEITLNDNCTPISDIELYFNGKYDLSVAGEYTVHILAYDKERNKAEKEVSILVKDDKAPTPLEESNTSNNNEQYPATDHHTSTNSSPQTPSKPSDSNQNNNYIPNTRSFTIDEFDTFEECRAACNQYINECFNQGYIGHASAEILYRDDNIIGYQAIFD